MYQYFFKTNQCKADTSKDDNCICWHNEGSGPIPDAKHNEENTLLEWRNEFDAESNPNLTFGD